MLDHPDHRSIITAPGRTVGPARDCACSGDDAETGRYTATHPATAPTASYTTLELVH